MFFIFLLSYILILLLFPMSLQTMESYAYAAAAEGYYNLSSTFVAMHENIRIPDFSHYHPNHPLPHLIASALYHITGTSALQVFRAMNFVGTVVFVCFHYGLALRVLQRKSKAAMATALSGVTYAVWASALSGEVQMFALALLMAGFYFLAKFFQAPADTTNTSLHLAALFYLLAVAFHQASFFAGVPAAFAALLHSRTRRSLWLYARVAAMIIVGWVLFYVVLLVLMLDIDSFRQYLDTLFVYRLILTREYAGNEWLGLLTGAAMRSVSFADFGISYLLALAFFSSALAGFWHMFRSELPKPVWILLAGLPIFQILLQLAVRGRPDGINFWLFLIPCFSLAVFSMPSARTESPGNTIFGWLLILLIALANFHYFFLPNHRLTPEEAIYSRQVKLLHSMPVAVIVHEPVLTFAEGWSLGSESGLRRQTWFLPCCGEKDYEKKLAEWLARHDEFLLLSDSVRARELHLPETQFQSEVFIHRQGKIAATTVPRSVYFTSAPGEYYPKELLLVRARHRVKQKQN
jgi:hypothetical protein